MKKRRDIQPTVGVEVNVESLPYPQTASLVSGYSYSSRNGLFVLITAPADKSTGY